MNATRRFSLPLLIALTAVAAAACKPQSQQQQAADTPPQLPQPVAEAGPETANPAAAASLPGKYSDGESELELRADGSYVQTLHVAGNEISAGGRWSSDEGQAIVLDPEGASAAGTRFDVLPGDGLRSADGSRIFHRVAGE